MGAGAAAGQEGDAYSGEACYVTHSGGECYIKDKPVSLQLQPVSIEGRRTSANETAASISVIGGDEIERINALRLGDVLANVPGVFFSGLNGPRETPQIRNTLSFDNRTLFVEDGVPLQSSVCLLYTSPSPRDRG